MQFNQWRMKTVLFTGKKINPNQIFKYLNILGLLCILNERIAICRMWKSANYAEIAQFGRTTDLLFYLLDRLHFNQKGIF